MPTLLKIRTDRGDVQFRSMRDDGPTVGTRFTWGRVGETGNYRSRGDAIYLEDGDLRVGDLVLVRERQSASKVFIVALLRVTALRAMPGDIIEPEYEMVERFDGSATLDVLRASNPAMDGLPYFAKNAKGMMLRSFIDLPSRDLTVILDAVRASMAPTTP